MENLKIKKILILVNTDEELFELSREFILIFPDFEINFLFYSDKVKVFLDGMNSVDSMEDEIIKSEYVINLLPVTEHVSRDISRKVEELNVKIIGNSLSTRMIFLKKNNAKRILEKYKLKMPIFEFIGYKMAYEAFTNFTQPSRIFSKEKNYFSDKIDSLVKMEDVFDKELDEDKKDYFIEEFVEGKEIYSLVFKKDNKILSYSILKNDNNFSKLSPDLNNKISEFGKNFFQNIGIESFVLLSLKENSKGEIIILNIFIELYILNSRKEVLNKIMEQESKEFSDIFSI